MIISLMTIMTIIKMVKNFNNKLMVLMSMEMIFLLCIFNLITSKSSVNYSGMFITMTLFMVLDSTMGLTILISMSRNSTETMKTFYSV